MTDLTFAEKNGDEVSVLLDGKPIGTVASEEIYDEYRRMRSVRYFPSIKGDRIGRHAGYRTPEAAAKKIKARTTYLRRAA